MPRQQLFTFDARMSFHPASTRTAHHESSPPAGPDCASLVFCRSLRITPSPIGTGSKFGARRVRIRLRRCSRSQRIPERSGPDRCRNPDRRLDDPPACDRRQRYTRRRERAGDDHRWRRDEHAPHGEVLTTQPHLMERQPLPHEETGFQRGVGSWESAQSSHESTA